MTQSPNHSITGLSRVALQTACEIMSSQDDEATVVDVRNELISKILSADVVDHLNARYRQEETATFYAQGLMSAYLLAKGVEGPGYRGPYPEARAASFV